MKAGKRDTVATIARRYRLSPAQVADWNDVGASAAFKAGQQVVVFLPVKTGVRSPGRVARQVGSAPRGRPQGSFALVRQGPGEEAEAALSPARPIQPVTAAAQDSSHGDSLPRPMPQQPGLGQSGRTVSLERRRPCSRKPCSVPLSPPPH